MKIIILYLFLLFSLNADDTLRGLFKQLKSVTKEEKFKVVNEIKKHIIQLKQKEQIEAIRLLKAKKEAPKQVSEHEILNEPLLNNEENSVENMEEMIVPSIMPEMEHMPSVQNMNTMRNMPLMQDIMEQRATAVRSATSEGMREMIGNR